MTSLNFNESPCTLMKPDGNFLIAQIFLLMAPAKVVSLVVSCLGKIQKISLKSSSHWKYRVFSTKVTLPNLVGFGVSIIGSLFGVFMDWFFGNPITAQSFDFGIWSCLLANAIIILWIYTRRIWSPAGNLIQKLTRSLKPLRLEYSHYFSETFTSALIKPENRPPICILFPFN